MKKTIAIAITLILSLSLVLFGCDGDSGEGTTSGTDTVAGTNNIADGNDAASDEGNAEPKEGYLDEATGYWHTTLYDTGAKISFSVFDGWWVQDNFPMGGGICAIWPPEGTDYEEVPGIIIQYNLSDQGAQAVYDTMNENGSLGESQEVTYGSNIYVANVTPTHGGEGNSYFYYTGKAAPVVYIHTTLNDANKAALEEFLTTLTY